MKKLKIAIFCIFAAVIGIIFFQNRELIFLIHKLRFIIYEFEFQVGLYLVFFLFSGMLIMYFFSLSDRFAAAKEIRRLSEACSLNKEKINSLENQMAANISETT